MYKRQLKDKMIQGSYAFTVAYSGDALYMQNQNAELNGGESVLEYVIPKEGSNFWIDAMCIPTTSPVSYTHLFQNFDVLISVLSLPILRASFRHSYCVLI